MSLEANPCEAALSAAGLKADEEGWYSGAQLRDYNKVRERVKVRVREKRETREIRERGIEEKTR